MDSSKSTRLSYLLCAYLSSFVYKIINSSANYASNINESLNIALNTSNMNFQLLQVRRIQEQGQHLGGYIIVALKDTLYVAFKGTSSNIETKANITSVPDLIGKAIGLPSKKVINDAQLLNYAMNKYEKVYESANGITQTIEFSKIHTGLYYTYLRNISKLYTDLTAFLDSNSYNTVVFTGHSMGAWLAAMTNIDLANHESGRTFTLETNGYSRTTKGTGAKLERELVWKYNDKIINTISICFSLPPLQHMGTIGHAARSGFGHLLVGGLKRMALRSDERHGGTLSIANHTDFKSPTSRRANFTNYRKTLNRQTKLLGSGKNRKTVNIKNNNLCRFARRSNIRIVQFNFAHDPVSNGKIRSLMGNLAGSANCARTTHDIFTTTVAYNSSIQNESAALSRIKNYLEVSRSMSTPQVFRHSMTLYILCLIISLYRLGGESSVQFGFEYVRNIATKHSILLVKQALNARSEQAVISAVYPLYLDVNFSYAHFKSKTDSSNPHKFLFAKMFNSHTVENNKSKHFKTLLNKFKNIYKINKLRNTQQAAPRQQFLAPFNSFLNAYIERHNLKKGDYRPYFAPTLKGWAAIHSSPFTKQKILENTIKNIERRLN